MSVSYEHKLEWIIKEDSTILVFLPLPDTARATSSQSGEDMSDTGQLPGHEDARRIKLSNPTTPRPNPTAVQTGGATPGEPGK